MRHLVWGVAVLSLALVGCMHGRGEHTIPISRDYRSLEKTRVPEAKEVVMKAHRVGAHNFAPYEYDSASNYLKWAEEERSEGDNKGAKDYSTLAKTYANDAIAKGSGIPDKGAAAPYRTVEDCKKEYARLVARYRELNPCKAKLVAPETYAHLESNLSLAEHELAECGDECEAWRLLACVEPDIDAIWAKDTDHDGVPDMQDGDPWIPEDKDGFQDEDGIPEPKPYPQLPPVYFKSDSAKLSGEAVGYLRGIAKMLVDGYSEATVHIEGYTDSDASDQYNLGLSQRRVDNVRECLVKNGAKADAIKAGFKGETNPVASNTTESGKAENRRVEIWLDSPDPKSPYCN